LFLSGNAVWLDSADVSRATPYLEEALSLASSIRDWSNYAWLMFTLAAAARAQGKYTEAESRYVQVLELINDRKITIYLNWPELFAGALAGLAGVAVARGRPVLAARLLGAASHAGDPWLRTFMHVDRDADLAATRERIGDDAALEAAFA